jgi:hypothetical protein
MMNEVLLPATPLDSFRRQRAMAGVEVRNVRDELFLSARGNPIGIRITFDVVVPQTGDYGISASTLGPVAEGIPWALSFGHSMRHIIEPPPSRISDFGYDRFQKGVVYTVSQEMMPEFLNYDDTTKQPCLVNVTTTYVSEADVVSALERSTDMKYRTEIQIGGGYGTRTIVAKEYVTSHGYDVKAMHQTGVIEGNQRCRF